MTEEIRLVKGRELGNRGWSLGVSNPLWDPSWIKVTFPGSGPLGGKKLSLKKYISIRDGDLDGIEIYYRSPAHNEQNIPPVLLEKAGQPVPKEDILEGLLAESGNIRTSGRGGNKVGQKSHFGINKKWYVDYDPALEPILSKYRVAFETNQTIGESTFNTVMGTLAAQGITAPEQAPGQKAIEEALKHKESEEIKALKAELEALKAAQATPVTEEPKKAGKPKKEKEVANV
jgi:hypothetical protein